MLKLPSRRTLNDLLASASTDDSSTNPAMAEILRRFEPLAVKVARAIDPPHHLLDDLINAARMGLVDAVGHHDGRAGFPSFARTYMRGAALRELGRWIVPETALTDALDEVRGGDADRDELEAADRLAPWGAGQIARLVDELDGGQRNIVEMRYCQDMAMKDIAIAVGTSRPAVSQRLATIHRHVALAMAA